MSRCVPFISRKTQSSTSPSVPSLAAVKRMPRGLGSICEPPCCENPRSHSLTTSFLGRLVTFSCLPSVKVRRKNKNGMPAHIFVVDDQHDQPSQGRRSTTTVSNVSRRNGRPAAIAGARYIRNVFFCTTFSQIRDASRISAPGQLPSAEVFLYRSTAKENLSNRVISSRSLDEVTLTITREIVPVHAKPTGFTAVRWSQGSTPRKYAAHDTYSSIFPVHKLRQTELTKDSRSKWRL